MLSIENPPPDPACACQFPQLNSSSCDERASYKQKQQLVDLPNPPLDDQRTPLSNFSIRDYVFIARKKDIKKSWPFSLKNLQVCLSHGVKEVLPPFQSLDAVRNKSYMRCPVEAVSSEKFSINKCNSDKKLSNPNNCVLLELDSSYHAQLNNYLAESCVELSSCKSGEENDFPSTTRSVSQSEIKSVSCSRQLSSRIETETSLKASVEAAAGLSVAHKTEGNSRSVGKRCKLIVRFGDQSDRTSPEDIASNCSAVSETMTSKVCPVCKTFSSSSNTTLNAHIDQCLSLESSPKWTADAKKTRHRIKPRKTRLMVDVYATARHCTLEELDQRNGTSWATVSRLPAQETRKMEASNDGKRKVSPVQLEDAGDVGSVYIDSNGTKVRILSKLNDSSEGSKVREDMGARKALKGSKASKYISKKKKRRLAQKHQKYLKHGTQTKTFFSFKDGSQICGNEAEGCDVDGSSGKELQLSKQITRSDSQTFGPRVCSKRRGFTKKITSQESHQPMKREQLVSRDLCEDDQSLFVDSLSENNHGQEYRDLVSIEGNNKRSETAFHGAQVNERKDCSTGSKRIRSLLGRTRTMDNVENSLLTTKQNVKKLGKNNTSSCNNCMQKPPNATGNHATLLRKKTVDAHKDFSADSSSKSSKSCRAIVNKAIRLSSFRKNVLSASARSSAAECGPGSLKKWSNFQKSLVHAFRRRDDEFVAPHCKLNQQYVSENKYPGSQFEREEVTDKVSVSRSTILEIGKEKRFSCSMPREKALTLKTLKSGSHCYDLDKGINIHSSNRVNDFDCLDSAEGQVQVNDDVITESYPKVFYERSAISLSEAVETESYKNKSRDTFRSIEDYEQLLSGAKEAGGPKTNHEMFSAHEAGIGMLRQNGHMEMKIDSELSQGKFCHEVDPIPIPGPPGSFLPSPRDMSSEDFQGNSSLTSSRVQSSRDQHGMVDRESSDSPISAASTLSNSTAGRNDFKSSELSPSVGSYAIGEKVRLGFLVSSIDSSIPKAGQVSQRVSMRSGTTTADEGYCKLNRIYTDKGSPSSKNDQPCCCQRKERLSASFVLNHEVSQLLMRRKMAPIMVPAVGKPICCSSNPRHSYLDTPPQVADPSNCATFGSPQKIVSSVSKPSACVNSLDSQNTGVRFSVRADGDSASPSGSNPILRLMGKNLMVVNKDEDASVAVEHVQPGLQNNHQISESPTFSTVSPGNDHMVPEGSIAFGVEYRNPVCRRFDVGLSNSFGSYSDSKLPQGPVQLPAGLFENQCTDHCSPACMGPHRYNGDYHFPCQQNMLESRLNISPKYDTDKTTTPPYHYCKHADSSNHLTRGIILINDLTSDAVNCSEVWPESQAVSSGISHPTLPVYNPSCMRPSCYQSEDLPPFGERPMVCATGFHSTSSRMANASPVTLSCTSEGAVVVPRNHFTAVPSSSGLRSTAPYYSPGFS